MKLLDEGKILLKYLLFLLVFFTFFATRKVFLIPFSYITGQYSDFTTFSLYISDFFIIGLAFYAALQGKLKPSNKKYLFAFGLVLISSFLFHLRGILSFNLYFLSKLLELYILYETLKAILDLELIVFILRLFVIFALIETIIAVGQFYFQRSFGLHLLGESLLSPSILDVAKLQVSGQKLMRGYGTFPHPNLLSAYFLAGSLFAIYLWSLAKDLWTKYFYLASLALLIFALFITFSRASWLAFGVSISMLIFSLAMHQGEKKIPYPIIITIVLAVLGASLILKPYLLTRETLSDQATVARGLYNKIGLRMLEKHPIIGYGAGTSLFHMEQYAPRQLAPWEIQPIHNYFLLSAVELGIIGALALIYIFLSHLYQLVKKFLKAAREQGNDETFYQVILISLFSGFLILMLFDHYFYTLQQTQILLWAVLGLIGYEIKKATA